MKEITPADAELIERHLPLVGQIVAEIQERIPPYVNGDDLYSAGLIGLMDASHKYSDARQVSFGNYAAIRIRGSILDELRKMDPNSRRVRAFARKTKAARLSAEQRHGRPVTREEIGKELGLSLEDFEELSSRYRPIRLLSIDVEQCPENTGSGFNLLNFLYDENLLNGREALERDELIALFAKRLSELPDIPKEIMAMCYFQDMSYVDIGEVFNLSASRIQQIHKQTLSALREWFERKIELRYRRASRRAA